MAQKVYVLVRIRAREARWLLSEEEANSLHEKSRKAFEDAGGKVLAAFSACSSEWKTIRVNVFPDMLINLKCFLPMFLFAFISHPIIPNINEAGSGITMPMLNKIRQTATPIETYMIKPMSLLTRSKEMMTITTAARMPSVPFIAKEPNILDVGVPV